MTHNLEPRPRSKQFLWLWLGYWLGLFILMHVPAYGLRRLRFEYADKIAHFLLYFFLAYLGGRYLSSIGRAKSTMSLIGYACVYAAYGAFDEWLQQFVGRTMSLGDWLADAAGIALATTWLVYRRRSIMVSDPKGRV